MLKILVSEYFFLKIKIQNQCKDKYLIIRIDFIS